ncbi:MAG: hydrogenase small subunit [Coriobacteriales bacterium]|jgi:hydrogenase small subunit|nr:hydrogenase small subunit [Coriobacteriales bacterium]
MAAKPSRFSGFRLAPSGLKRPTAGLCVSSAPGSAPSTENFDQILEQRGVNRRDFLKLCAGIAATLGLSQAMVPQIAEALEESVIGATQGKLVPAIWLELASCTGCTESLAQAETPDIATIVLDMISLTYAETLSAGAGFSLEEAKEQTIEAGDYLLFIEGALMEGWDGNALRIADEKGTEIVEHAASRALAIICVGSCAVDGGWQAAYPNPGGAIGIAPYLEKAKAAGRIETIPPIINVPTCPSNPEHLIAVLVDVLLLSRLPELNSLSEPALIFGQTIHDNCPRRGHFENGEFVYKFGSKEEAQSYCLYAMGCKGPQTKANCPIVRWNRRSGWCVESGAPCAGCASADPTKQGFNWVDLNAPFLGRFKNVGLGGLSIDPTFIAYGVAGVVAVALVIHGFGMKATGRTKGGAPFELERAWDKKHPDEAVGAAAAAKEAARVEGREWPSGKTEQAQGTDASDDATASKGAGANSSAKADAAGKDAMSASATAAQVGAVEQEGFAVVEEEGEPEILETLTTPTGTVIYEEPIESEEGGDR